MVGHDRNGLSDRMTEERIVPAAGQRRNPSARRGPALPAAAALSALVALPLLAAGPGHAAARPPVLEDRTTVAEALRPTFDAALRRATDTPPPAPAPPPAVPKLELPGSWPAVEVRTLLVGIHLLGLCFGLGGATMLDFWILRWILWGYLPDNVVRTFEFVSKAVSAGLVLLWLSGGGFLVLYESYDPAKLANPKILAKLAIVGALSVNGLLIHRWVLPYVARARALPLFDGLRRRRRMLFVVSGALSGVSWYAAFALGLLREFNGRVPAATLLGVWLILVLLSTAAMECCSSSPRP